MGELDLVMVQELWPAVLQGVEATNQLIAMSLAKGQLVSVSGRDVIVAFTPDCAFQKRKVEDAAARQLVTGAIKELVGIAPRVIYETRDAAELEAEPEVISEDDFIARLRAEFDAVDHQPDTEEEQEQA
jgi:DNA polymerase-3 subunit gamma/tau